MAHATPEIPVNQTLCRLGGVVEGGNLVGGICYENSCRVIDHMLGGPRANVLGRLTASGSLMLSSRNARPKSK